MKKKMLAMVMSCLMVAAAGGCTGSETEPATAPETTETEEVTETEAAEQTEAKDTSGKVWKIATDTAFKPFEYTDDSGNFVGIDMDILAAVAEDQGFEYEVQVLGWDASIAACHAGQADGMIA